MNELVPTKQAAKELGMSVNLLRYRMKKDKEFAESLGFAFPPEEKGGNWRFYIYRAKLDRKIGVIA